MGMTVNDFKYEASQLARLPQDAETYRLQITSDDGGASTKWLSIDAATFRAVSAVLTGAAERQPAEPYVVQYRDPAGFTWADLDEHRYHARGAALMARDELNEDQVETFPGITANLHRVVDLADGSIVEWLTAHVES